MAPPSLKLLSFFLYMSLFLSHQAQARSFFFSKVANTNNIPKTEESPKKETTTTKPEQEEPTFIPQTETQNGYGLYGHDDEDDSTTEATNDNDNIPYTHYNKEKSGNLYNNNFETKISHNGDAKLTRHSKGLYNRDERQGMSDTRYVENGKYYYDLDDNEQSQYRNSELVDSRKWNNNQQGQYRNSEMVDSRNWYNNKGYYGSNNQKQITYENNDVYQNEEFQESEDDQFVP